MTKKRPCQCTISSKNVIHLTIFMEKEKMVTFNCRIARVLTPFQSRSSRVFELASQSQRMYVENDDPMKEGVSNKRSNELSTYVFVYTYVCILSNSKSHRQKIKHDKINYNHVIQLFNYNDYSNRILSFKRRRINSGMNDSNYRLD